MIDHKLVKEVAGEFLSGGLEPNDPILSDDLVSRILALDKLDSQAFVDAVLLRVERNIENDLLRNTTDRLFSPLVNVLYQGGAKRLILDYRTFPHTVDFGRRLAGIEGNLLEVRLILPVGSHDKSRYACTLVSYAEIEVIGSTYTIGTDASDSIFHASRLPRYLGFNANRCSFYVDQEAEISPAILSKSEKQVGHYLTTSDSIYSTFLPDSFFSKKNRIFLPDSKGGWEEIQL